MARLSLLVCLLSLGIPQALSAGFGGIPGQYCAIRSPVKCCPSRDDDCTMPILGNHLCYCDMFCRRPDADNGDCCPDFKFVCEGEPPVLKGECRYQGVLYYTGDTVQQNCNTCTCQTSPTNPNEHHWNCPNKKPCMIEEEAMNTINSGRYTWTARNYTRFWGKELDFGMKYRLGTLYPEKSVENMNEILIKPELPLPDRFDATEKWGETDQLREGKPGFIHKVRDQENCGSSWAYSTTATSADRLAIMSEGKINAELSPQQLLSCNQHRQHGCEGGYLDRAWWYIRKLGVVSRDCYPYTSGRTNEPGICQIPKSQYRRSEGITCPSPSGDNKIYKMTPPYRVSSKEEDIMTEIMTNGPVQATFLVHEDFFMYSGGVYKYADIAPGQHFKREGYHSVRILGWGVDRSHGHPQKYWLAANSWGVQWGEEGLFKIARGENHCQVEAFIIGAWGKGSKKRRRRFKIRRLKLKRLRKLRRL